MAVAALAHTPVPVTMGSPRFKTRETDSFRVVEAWFPPGAVLDAHSHDRPVMRMRIENRAGRKPRFHHAKRIRLACLESRAAHGDGHRRMRQRGNCHVQRTSAMALPSHSLMRDQ